VPIGDTIHTCPYWKIDGAAAVDVAGVVAAAVVVDLALTVAGCTLGDIAGAALALHTALIEKLILDQLLCNFLAVHERT